MKKKTKCTLTPKLRFPEFGEGAEWKAKPLGEMCDRILEKVGDTPLTPVSISAGKGFVSQVEKFGRDISGDQYKNYIFLRKGDFAYNKGNSKSYPQGCVRRLKEFDQAAAPSAFVSFRLHDGYIPEYFEGLFEKNAHGRQLIKFITSSARSDGLLNISPDEFFSVHLPLPPANAEQRKIADCLSSLDGLIAAEGRKLTALKAHKRGLMQQLFPQPGQTKPRLRFPEFRDKGEWKTTTVGECVKTITPPKRLLTSEYGDKGRFPIVDQSPGLYCGRTDDSDAILTKDLPFTIFGDHTCVVKFVDHPFAQGADGIKILKAHSIVDDLFLYFSLQARPLSSTQYKRHFTTLKEQEIVYPDVKTGEQQRIADCLAALDNQIAAQTSKLDALKTHKRGLMQQLFPAPEEHK